MTGFDPCRVFRKLAYNNALANLRLSNACLLLQPGEFETHRTSFFPSIRMQNRMSVAVAISCVRYRLRKPRNPLVSSLSISSRLFSLAILPLPIASVA